MRIALYHTQPSFVVKATAKVAANLLSPTTPFDLEITALGDYTQETGLQTLPYLAGSLVKLYVVDRITGKEKDVVSGFTRLNSNSTLLLNCVRDIGREINIGDTLRAYWGGFDVEYLESILNGMIAGGRTWLNISAIATLTLAQIRDNWIKGTVTGGAFALTLPAVGATEDGYQAYVSCEGGGGANLLTLTPNGADTLDGAASVAMADGDSVHVVYDHAATNWRLM